MIRFVLLVILALGLTLGAGSCSKSGNKAGGDVSSEKGSDTKAESRKKSKKRKKKSKPEEKTAAKEAKADKEAPGTEAPEEPIAVEPDVAAEPSAGPAGAADAPEVPAAEPEKAGANQPTEEPGVAAAGPGEEAVRAAAAPRNDLAFAPPAEPIGPKATIYLTVADLVNVLQSKGWVAMGPFPGMARTGSYNSIQYVKPGSDRLVGLQVWEFKSFAAATAHWNELLGTYPNAETVDEMMVKDVFFWHRDRLAGLVFLEQDRNRVLGLVCHNEVCTDTQLYKLALTIHGRAR